MSVFDKFSGINIASGFKLQAERPLDPRLVVDTQEDRNNLITEYGAYEGMQVYVKEDKKAYFLKDLRNRIWEEVGSTSSSIVSVILRARDWVRISDNVSQQEIVANGVTPSSTVLVAPAGNPMSYANSGIYCSEEGNNSLTFICDILPTIDIKVNVLIFNQTAFNNSDDTSDIQQTGSVIIIAKAEALQSGTEIILE